MKKAIIFTLLGLVIGLAVGFLMTMSFFGSTTATAMFMLQEEEIFEMGEAAEEAYRNQPNQVAIWALENYITTLNRLIEQRSSADVETPYVLLTPIQSLAFAHTRTGQLYKKMGDIEKSKYHFEQAILHIKNTNLKFIKTEEDLINFVNNLDQKE